MRWVVQGADPGDRAQGGTSPVRSSLRSPSPPQTTAGVFNHLTPNRVTHTQPHSPPASSQLGCGGDAEWGTLGHCSPQWVEDSDVLYFYHQRRLV